MKEITVKLIFTEDILGTATCDKDIHSAYIASKAPDALSMEEEIAALGTEETEARATSRFSRNDLDTPILFDYQIKGFFKAACSALSRIGGRDKAHNESGKLKAHKKIIDTLIFVYPRQIPIHVNGDISYLQRPLRVSNAQGERVALAKSESIGAGSFIEITIVCLADEHTKVVEEWLGYGRFVGLGQWRNASYGRFSYEILENWKDSAL